MPKVNFTKPYLESLSATQKQVWLTDSKTNGLSLCVNPEGSKTFYFYKKINGIPRRIKLGRFGDLSIENARAEVQKILGLYALGMAPHAEKPQRQQEVELTLSELFAIYHKEHCLQHLKRPEFVTMLFNKHIRRPFGRRLLSTIKRRDIRELHTELTQSSGPAAANRVLEVIRPIFNFGIAEEYHKGPNPATLIRKNRMASRERFLSDDELRSFFAALEEESADFSDLFTLLLLTGARKTTVLSMRWKDIDMHTRLWTVTGDNTKNGRTNIMVIPARGIDILTQRQQAQQTDFVEGRLAAPSPFVFPGTGQSGHLHDPRKAWYRVMKRMKVDDICIHDLRRTLASYMAMSGVPLPVISKALNHRSINVTAIYARLADSTVKAAIDAVAVQAFSGQSTKPKERINWTINYHMVASNY